MDFDERQKRMGLIILTEQARLVKDLSRSKRIIALLISKDRKQSQLFYVAELPHESPLCFLCFDCLPQLLATLSLRCPKISQFSLARYQRKKHILGLIFTIT